MRSHVSSALGALVLSLVNSIYSQSLPYNPTVILLPEISSANQGLAYIFTQESDSRKQSLVTLNISSTISASDISLEAETPNLPFNSDHSSAIIPSISADGVILVYTGSCSDSKTSVLWRYRPSNASQPRDGSWSQVPSSSSTSASLSGANYLSSGFTFSNFVRANESQTDFYIFGGMCPRSNSSSSTWQSEASYSSRMLQFAPTSNSAYKFDIPSSRSPPVAEAGFTMTGLTPTYSNGSGTATQQQNFVLVGGHTQTAFINMSQVAIWSLPEKSWSFVVVALPSTDARTELAVRAAAANVDSRSGHTAVLTKDGSKIIIFGGWVGDVTQAAEPQLVVLDIGTGFGGAGDWAWSIPPEQPSGPGIYGHGAAMLPGNVMMVLGGYNISPPGSSKRDIISGSQAMFFNATDLTWSSKYTNPASVAPASPNTSTSNSKAKSIGLGVGVGLGILATLAVIGALLWYRRRQRWKREEIRERNILALSQGAADFYTPTNEKDQARGGFPWTHGGWNGSGKETSQVSDSSSAVAGYESLHAESHRVHDSSEGIPSPPKHISRKPVKGRSARGLYQPAPNFDQTNARANSLGTAGPIHPIYEIDEDDNAHGSSKVGVALGEPPGNSSRYSDPFKDPLGSATILRNDNRASSTPSPESPAHEREREIQNWIADWAAADALLNTQARSHSSGGRLSPSRRAQLIAASSISSVSGEEDSGRTGSNLSDRSIALSAMSVSRSGSSSQKSRSDSLRGRIASAMYPFASTIVSTTVVSTAATPVFDSAGAYGSRLAAPPRSAGSGSSSFTTAHTSFGALQVEGETLLPRPDDPSSGVNSPTHPHDDAPGSPSKTRKRQSLGNRTGWLGSIRRAFASEAAENHRSSLSPSQLTNRDRQSAPFNDTTSPPRRTLSAGATLWRRKQGKGDWEDSEDEFHGRSNTFTGPPTAEDGADDDDDWDIERAVQNRVVQVMFTVPKEKLRVVNGRASEEDERSLRSMRREDDVGEKQDEDGEGKIEVAPEGLDRGEDGEKDHLVEESPRSRPKGKVLEIVEIIEGRAESPGR